MDAKEWLRRWYAIGKARCGRQGLVLLNRPVNYDLAMPLLDELGRTPGLQDAVKEMIRPPFPLPPRRRRQRVPSFTLVRRLAAFDRFAGDA